MNATAAHQKHLLLIGSGRANLATLQAFAEQGVSDTRITLVAQSPCYTEASLLGDFVAGNLELDDIRRPLQGLLDQVGGDFIAALPTGLDPVGRLVQLSTGETLSYDVLGINHEPIIDRPAMEQFWPGTRQNALFVNPIETFVQLWPQIAGMAQAKPMHIAVIGHERPAVELALCIADALHEPQGSRVSLITQGHEPLAQEPARLRQKTLEHAKRLGIALIPKPVAGFTPGRIHLEDGLVLQCDAPLVSLPAAPATWLAHTGLVVDEQGFADVNDRLQSESHRQIFIAHDLGNPHLGPAYAANLRVALHGGNFTSIKLSPPGLNTISLGHKLALAAWGPFSMEGSNVWNWKSHRDFKLLNNLLPASIDA